MSSQGYRDLADPEEVVEDREHFLIWVVIFFKAWQVDDFFKLIWVVVAEMEQQVISMISNNRRKKPMNLFIRDRNTLGRNRISKNALPDVVIVLIEMPDNAAFVAALVAILVLEQSYEVRDVDSYWAECFSLVPLALVFRNPDVTCIIVLQCQNLLEDVHQIIKVVN